VKEELSDRDISISTLTSNPSATKRLRTRSLAEVLTKEVAVKFKASILFLYQEVTVSGESDVCHTPDDTNWEPGYTQEDKSGGGIGMDVLVGILADVGLRMGTDVGKGDGAGVMAGVGFVSRCSC